MEGIIKIGLVEDQKLFREGIIAILNNRPDIKVVFESPDGFSVADRLAESDEIPDVMLIDLTLPKNGNEEFNGWEVLKVLQERHPGIRNLILSVHDDKYLISKMIEEGAQGYLVKDSDPDEVYKAIVNIYEEGSYINAQTLNAIQGKLKGEIKPPKAYEQLTLREVEVLRLICQQMTSEEIGEKLFISPKTVNGHRNNLLQKTASRNFTGLVMYAVKHHLVELV
jgi:two-component system response regulator NreC